MNQKIIAITGFKGGVGKSTTAIHLAGYLALKSTAEGIKEKVLVIDGDDNRSAKKWGKPGLLPFAQATEKEAIRVIRNYDWVIVDTAARPESTDLEELTASSDLIILPVKPDGMSIEPTLEAYSAIPEKVNKKIVICDNPAHPAKDGELLIEELEANNFKFFKSVIRRTKAFGLAYEQGVLIKDVVHRGSYAWYDYTALGKEVLENLRENTETD